MKQPPCQHRRRTVSGYYATGLQADTRGKVTRWGVIEDMKCVKCGHVRCRWSVKGYGARTARDALKRYGVLEPDLPTPTNHEWLMGWPPGWSDFAPLATAKFQQWLQQHGVFSAALRMTSPHPARPERLN